MFATIADVVADVARAITKIALLLLLLMLLIVIVSHTAGAQTKGRSDRSQDSSNNTFMKKKQHVTKTLVRVLTPANPS